MPLKRNVVGCFLALHDQMKERNVRLENIAQDLNSLWNKLNFPVISKQRVKDKVSKLINGYVHYCKNKKKYVHFEQELLVVFDITRIDGNWLCSEDKELHQIQVQSQGSIGYTTAKVAPLATIHPSIE